MMLKLLTLVGLSAVGAIVLLAGERVKANASEGKMKPRVSHADLAKKQQPIAAEVRDRSVRLDDLRKDAPAEGVAGAAAEAERTKSLVGRSSILSSGTNWTIVPKGSVLHVPDRYKSRVDGPRKGTLIGWQDFLVQNRNWLKLQEISLPQARGEVPLNTDLLKGYQSSGVLVVAVCRGGPISVKQPKEPSEDPAEAVALQEQMEAQQKQEKKALDELKQRLLRRLR